MTTAVYRIFDADDALLYVGMSSNVRARIAVHSQRPWWPEGGRVDVEQFETREAAARAEMNAIVNEHPEWNRYVKVAEVADLDQMTTEELMAELHSLTAICNKGMEAEKRARDLVRDLLRDGWPVRELVDRPFTKATVYSIRKELQKAGELPDD